MAIKLPIIAGLLILPYTAMAADVYCPQKSGHINVGMTEAQVIAACGDPIATKESNRPATQKVPLKQLIYTSLNRDARPECTYDLYNIYSLPCGSTGLTLKIDIINEKVVNVNIDGTGSNATSICGGVDIQLGANENDVYAACGSPNTVNETFLNQPIPSDKKPKVWLYQIDQYHKPITLTFVNGKLQSID